MPDGAHFVDFLINRPHELYEEQPLSGRLNERIEAADVEQGYIRSTFLFDEEHCNFSGRVHGGMVSFALDETMGLAAFVHVGTRFKGTVEIKTSFFKPTPTGVLRIEAWVEHAASTLLFIRAKASLPDETVVATASATIAIMPVKSD